MKGINNDNYILNHNTFVKLFKGENIQISQIQFRKDYNNMNVKILRIVKTIKGITDKTVIDFIKNKYPNKEELNIFKPTLAKKIINNKLVLYNPSKYGLVTAKNNYHTSSILPQIFPGDKDYVSEELVNINFNLICTMIPKKEPMLLKNINSKRSEVELFYTSLLFTWKIDFESIDSMLANKRSPSPPERLSPKACVRGGGSERFLYFN
jgi:hypothetical protein